MNDIIAAMPTEFCGFIACFYAYAGSPRRRQNSNIVNEAGEEAENGSPRPSPVGFSGDDLVLKSCIAEHLWSTPKGPIGNAIKVV